MKNGNGRSRAYPVGRGKPPKHTRFKPGQSGNPKGRPRGRRNLSTDVREALSMPVVVTEGGKRKKVTLQVGSILKVFEKGLKGDPRALSLILSLAARYNDEPPPPADEPLSAEEEAILADYVARHAGLTTTGTAGGPEAEADVKRAPEDAAGTSSSGKRSIPRRRSRRN